MFFLFAMTLGSASDTWPHTGHFSLMRWLQLESVLKTSLGLVGHEGSGAQ